MMSKNSRIEPGQPWVTISGQRVRLGGADVEEVDVLAVDLGRELRMGVDPRLGRPPVVAIPPVVVERADVRLLDAVIDVAGELVGPARPVESVAQVVEVGLRDVEGEGSDRSRRLIGPCLRVAAWNGIKCSVPLWPRRTILSSMESPERPAERPPSPGAPERPADPPGCAGGLHGTPRSADVGGRGACGRRDQRAVPALREQGGPAASGRARRAPAVPRRCRGSRRRRP